ncbi:MAG: aminomethyl-transferring glycine dehydrogenase subunit GcvPA, partial [SAR324 cluster bacterium]|nr:aminomethyl-transferring glycine dehydrogenase subunit GcvPA [SAR324 cluster bacterium]
MRYLPHTTEEIKEMLATLGKASLDDIFSMVPANSRVSDEIELPQPMTEWELNRHMDSLAATMESADKSKIFIGAGSYHHYIPEVVRSLISRSEFSTAYTPYQPEISQGTLQGIFEYQTLVARLLGLDVANASLYDGATALAESLLMAIRITKRKKVAISQAIHPHYRQVVATYFRPTEFEVVEIPYLKNGGCDLSALSTLEELAAVVVQSPNFFGVIEDLQAVSRKTENEKTLFICCFSEPLAYGLLKSPGSYGADIACGEGQSFGIPQSFGGPGLGMFACKGQYLRSMPGRLVGQTEDVAGKRGFVLTLSTREQHIRREKATSNICSNQGLCAMTSAIYMATVGRT